MKKYPKYKDSGIEWLGEIPEHWNMCFFKFILEVKDGTHDTPQYISKSENTIPFITSKDLKNGFIDFTECKYISYEDYIEINKRSNVEKNDIIMPMIGTVGNPVIVETDIKFSIKNVALFKDNKTNEMNYIKFLFYSNFILNQFEYHSTGGVQSFVSQWILKQLKVFKITLPEQKTIATYLDHKTKQIDILIEKKKRMIELLKEERTALINEAVTKGLDPNVKMKDSGIEWLGEVPEHWEVKKLNFIGDFSKGCGISKSDLTVEGVPVILYGDIYTKYEYKTNEAKRFTSIEQSKKSVAIKKNDLLLTGSGETKEDIGKCIVYLGSDNVFVGGDVIIYKVHNFNSIFLSYVLNCDLIKHQKALLAKGQIVVHIYSTQLKDINIPVPPISEQNKIANFIDLKYQEIENTIQRTLKSIELLQEYRTSLISEVVTGKIDVRDEKIEK